MSSQVTHASESADTPVAHGARPGNDLLQPDDPMGRWWPVWLVGCAVVLVAFRMHAFSLPLEADECNYALIAGRLLEGDRLYVDVWDHQPPGIFVLFAAVAMLFGQEPLVFRWTAMVFSLASLWLVFLLARRWGGTRAAMVAGLLFAIVSSDPGTAGEGCNREIFMNGFVLLSWYLVARRPALSRWAALSAGVVLAAGSVIKTVLVFPWMAMALACLVAPKLEGRLRPWRAGVVLVGCLALGSSVVWLSVFGYFAATGRWDVFVDATFVYNLSYGNVEGAGLSRFLHAYLNEHHTYIFMSALGVWVFGGLGTLWLAYRAVRTRRFGYLCCVLAVAGAYVAVCSPGKAWPHYYHLFIPLLVIAATVGVADVAAVVSRGAQLPAGAIWAALLVVPAWCAWTEAQRYLLQPPFGITFSRYNTRDFWARGQAAHVAAVTDPDDTVFVFGSDPGIYYYSGRRCASRYTMITGLTAGHRGAAERLETLMGELTARPPRLFIVVFDQDLPKPLERFLVAYYGQAIGVDYHDKTGEVIMAVFQRKDAPVRVIDWDWDRNSVGGW